MLIVRSYERDLPKFRDLNVAYLTIRATKSDLILLVTLFLCRKNCGGEEQDIHQANQRDQRIDNGKLGNSYYTYISSGPNKTH